MLIGKMSSKILFNVLKYILIVSNVLLIAESLLFMICGKELMEVEFEEYDPRYKNLNENAMIFLVLMSIALLSVGIIGAVKAHLPLTLTYAILMTICLVLSATKLPARDIWSFLLLTFITGCAYSYAALINRIKKIEAATKASQFNKI